MSYVRLFQSAVDPADLEEFERLFEEDVKPVFTAFPGCLGIELIMNVDKNAGGLIEGAALSRWNSLGELQDALASRQAQEAMVRIVQLLHHEPVTKTFEVRA